MLIVGSGVTVHNFGLFGVRDRAAVKALAVGFEDWLETRYAIPPLGPSCSHHHYRCQLRPIALQPPIAVSARS